MRMNEHGGRAIARRIEMDAESEGAAGCSWLSSWRLAGRHAAAATANATS
jgi:hypothetical protein